MSEWKSDWMIALEVADALINKRIKEGDLPGDGHDQTAERNGLILASNIIRGLVLNGYPESGGWQPISTAPKDETRVLVYRTNWAESMLVGWAGEYSDWCVAGGYPLAGPTHWMPLPKPPEDA